MTSTRNSLAAKEVCEVCEQAMFLGLLITVGLVIGIATVIILVIRYNRDKAKKAVSNAASAAAANISQAVERTRSGEFLGGVWPTPLSGYEASTVNDPKYEHNSAALTLSRMKQAVPSGPMAYDGRAVPGTGLDGLQDTQPPTRPNLKLASLQIVPRSTQTSVDYWDDAWAFRYPDRGQVSFNVRKDSGLVVTLADEPGYPKVGYAITIDKRGGVMTNFADTVTSFTYVSRLPVMDTPINSASMVRNVELDSDATHHVRIVYTHGYIELYVDGLKVLACSDPLPTPGVQFVGFGCTGLRSGVGLVTDLTIT